MFSVYLTPAYGRLYKTKSAALADWNSNRDFKIYRGPYCSRRDLDELKEQFDNVYFWWNYPAACQKYKIICNTKGA